MIVESANMRVAGVGLGQLLLALDATMVSLVEAPRGLDVPVASAALIDSDDVRLGLAGAAGSADVFFLLGVADDEAVGWIDGQVNAPVAVFVKEPSDAVVATAVPVIAPTTLSTAAISTARPGESTRVATEVAMAFAVS